MEPTNLVTSDIAMIIGLTGTIASVMGAVVVKFYEYLIAKRRVDEAEKNSNKKSQSTHTHKEVREDSTQIALRAFDTADDVLDQVKVWLAEERAARMKCEEETRALHAKYIQLEDKYTDLSRKYRDVMLNNERLERLVHSLRDTLISDYARKPESLIPAGPPDDTAHGGNGSDKM